MFGELRGMVLIFIALYYYLPMNTVPGDFEDLFIALSGIIICAFLWAMEQHMENGKAGKKVRHELNVNNPQQETVKQNNPVQNDSGEYLYVELVRDPGDKDWKIKASAHAGGL